MEFLRNVPIGQYVSGKTGWLRTIDPRLKFAWALIFLLSPILAGPVWRVALVVLLLCITAFGSLPVRIVWRSLVVLIFLSFLFGIFSIFLPTNETASELAIRSPQELPNATAIGSSWEIIKMGPFNLGGISFGSLVIDRRSFALGVKTSTLIFTVVHSVNLMLITTSPEELMWTLQWYLRPFSLMGLPLDRLSFQLLLALRFIPLVQEEFQNIIRSILVRGFSFKELGFKNSIGVFLTAGQRLLINILLRAEQGADALIIRNGGFLLSPDLFKSRFFLKERRIWQNSCCAISLLLILFLRFKYGNL